MKKLEQIYSGYIVNIKGLQFRVDLDSKSFYIDQWNQWNVNKTCYFYDIENDKPFYIHTCYIVNDQGIAIGENIQIKIQIEEEKIQLKATSSSRLGFAWPIPEYSETVFSGILEPADLKYTNSYHYKTENHSDISIGIPCPVVEHSIKGNVFYVSFPDSDALKMHTFYLMNSYYANCSSNTTNLNVSISVNESFRDVRKQFYTPQEIQDIASVDMLSCSDVATFHCDHPYICWKDMKKLFYYGVNVVQDIPSEDWLEDRYKVCEKVQKKLMSEGIESILLGTLANNLYGVRCKINDIDIAVKTSDLKKAVDLACDEWELVKQEKEMCKFEIDGIIATICCYANSPHAYIESSTDVIRNIRVCRVEDLSSCRLWLYWFMSNRQDNYSVIKQKNDRRLLLMLSGKAFSPFIAAEVNQEIQRYLSRCPELIKLLAKFSGRIFSNIDSHYSGPSSIKYRVYQRGNTLLVPIVNSGSSKDVSITLKQKIVNAVFYDGVKSQECRIEYTNLNSSVVTMNVADFGLMECKILYQKTA